MIFVHGTAFENLAYSNKNRFYEKNPFNPIRCIIHINQQ